jgi:hypothetical protein
MSHLSDLCHSDVSLGEFASRIEMVRRRSIFLSAFVAALSVVWSATSAFAESPARNLALTATSQHALDQSSGAHQQSGLRTLSAPVVAGTAPSQLVAEPGLTEQQAITAAGSGNPAVTTPADPSIAVGPGNIVEAANSALAITPRAGGATTYMNISAMIRNTAGWNVRYPHVVYDPVSGLFILTVLQFNPTLSACVSQIAVMVSQSNPALTWTSRGTIIIDPELGGGMELSNVSLGLTANLVVETSDYESCTTGHAVASQTLILQRSDLVGGSLGVNSSAFLVGGPVGVQPAMGLSASSVAYEVANNATCSAVASGSVAVIAITGTPEARSVSHTCTADSETATSGPPFAAQNAATATLTTGDDRIQSAFWQGNALWIAGNTGCTLGGIGRSCLNVASIAASSTGTVGALTPLPTEGVPGAYVYDPAIALDSAGDAILTFDESSSLMYESVMVAAITGGTWSTPVALRTSKAIYSPGGCSICSWGDYSAAVQDSTHPTDVWVLSEETEGDTSTSCTDANTCWDTYIGRYTFAPPTISSLSPAAGPASGGQLVTVSGSDFTVGTTLFTFNGATVVPTSGSLTPDSLTFTTPASATSGVVNAQVGDSLGPSATGPGSGYIYVGLANYEPLSPFRILDTRPGSTCIQCAADPTFGPNTSRKLQLTGVTGLPVGTDPIPTDATAVVLNVTEVAGTASSILVVYPFGTGLPTASNLNFPPGKVIPNLVTVTMGQGGAVSIYNAAGTVNVLADVEGYFAPEPESTVAGEFHPIAPVRVCDTRSKSPTPFCTAHGALGSGATMIVNVTGTGADAIPGDNTAAAAVVNLTGIAGSASTYLSLFPTNSSGKCVVTGTSTLNLLPGVVEANRVMVQLGPATSGGPTTSLCVYNAVGTINVVIDANGWFGSATAGPGAQYQGIQPTRICDTRTGGVSCSAHSLGRDNLPVAGIDGIPSITSTRPPVAVIANLTAIAPSQATYLVTYPAINPNAPGASDINVTAGEVLPNLVVVQLAPPNPSPPAGDFPGEVYLYNPVGGVNAVIDIEGWFQ